MHNPDKIKGVPIEDCIRFVKFVLRQIFIFPNVVDRNDLLQIGLLRLLTFAKSKKFGKQNWLKANKTYLFKHVKWEMLKSIDKFRYAFTVGASTREKLNHLIKIYDQPSSDGFTDFYELKTDKISIVSNGVKLSNLLLSQRGRVENDYCLSSEDSKHIFSIYYDLYEYLEKNKQCKQIAKQIFIDYYGLISNRLTILELIEKYKKPKITICRYIDKVKKILLQDSGWLETEYGKKILSKIKNRSLY